MKCQRETCNNQIVKKDNTRTRTYCSQECARANFKAFVI